MSKIGRVFLFFCLALFISGSSHIAIAEAPQITLSQLRQQTEWSDTDILLGIKLSCEEYDFDYHTLMKDLAWKESNYGQTTRCGDNGKACGLYQFHKNTWDGFLSEFNKIGFDYNNNIDQIEITILALKKGYWKSWGPLKRKYEKNPIY